MSYWRLKSLWHVCGRSHNCRTHAWPSASSLRLRRYSHHGPSVSMLTLLSLVLARPWVMPSHSIVGANAPNQHRHHKCCLCHAGPAEPHDNDLYTAPRATDLRVLHVWVVICSLPGGQSGQLKTTTCSYNQRTNLYLSIHVKVEPTELQGPANTSDQVLSAHTCSLVHMYVTYHDETT